MNWQHFKAFLWLRWRLRLNQLKRAGTANTVILALMAPFFVLAPIVLFAGFFLAGLLLPPDPPTLVLYVWDGLGMVFLFCWGIGLLSELQRSEALSLEKFLHLPVSLTGVFLINYLSSLASLNLIVFVPAMIGLSLGLVLARGPAMLLLLPLVMAFLLMVTGVTYQFQGWLATLMANQRRRRTVIVLVTIVFVLLCQLPNLVNLVRPWKQEERLELTKRHAQDLAELHRSYVVLGDKEFQRRQTEMNQAYRARLQELEQQTLQKVEWTAWLLNLVLPPGWLALGAMAAAQVDILPALLCTLGLALIGTASLWRSYRTTVRLYTGQFTSVKSQQAATIKSPGGVFSTPSVGLIERDIPWLSEQATAITLASLRSLMRAPEAKMMLLSPLIMVVIFGGVFATQPVDQIPEAVRPLLAFSGMSMVLFGMVQFVGNQFGFDRSGFRVFVLCAARRRDILLGKNLAFAPLALGLSTAVVALLQVICPMRFDHFLATLPQLIAMYLLLCLVANLLSILAPMPIAAGSLKPAQVKVIPALLQVTFIFSLPFFLAPMLLPLGIELLLGVLPLPEWVEQVPICLILSVVECVAVVCIYSFILTWQGSLLHAREQKILEAVTTKSE